MSQHPQNIGRKRRKKPINKESGPKVKYKGIKEGCKHDRWYRIAKGHPYDFCLDCRTYLKEKQ